MSSPKIALVTGANKGIGKEVVRKLVDDGYKVYLGFRSADLGAAAVEEFKGKNVHPLLIDVSSDDSVKHAAAAYAKLENHLDVLVNNAGIITEKDTVEVPIEKVKFIYEVNVFGVIRTIQAFLPLLKAAQGGARIVNVSSGLASLTLHSDPSSFISTINLVSYNSSKTAVNAVSVAFAKELKQYNIKVNAADPGYCATDINNHSGPRSASQGADIIVKLAELPDDGPTGSYFNDDGVVPW